MVYDETFEDLKCIETGTNKKETDKAEVVTHYAKYKIVNEDSGDFTEIMIKSNRPLKATHGEEVKFRKTSSQATIMEAIKKG